MNVDYNLETYLTLISILLGISVNLFIIRLDWRRYGSLFILSAVIGNILCYTFVKLEFYTFPYRLFPKIFEMPVLAVSTVFPAIVLLGVRYSPKNWSFKIPFYWAIVHVGMLLETLVLNFTKLIDYRFKWDFWDSYTWWWIYLLVFEWIGGLIIPENLRKPIDGENLLYGRLGWAIFHFIVIITIFLGGVYLGFIKS